jgi:hypothetical protein
MNIAPINFSKLKSILFLGLISILTACGGGGSTKNNGAQNSASVNSSSNSSSITSYLMGGAIQGTPLNLAAVVTTFSGGAAVNFNQPEGITTDGTNLYVTDSLNDTIRKIEIATGIVYTLAGTAGKAGSANGIGAAARFNFPSGITSDGTHLYVAEPFVHTIRKIVIATRTVSTFAGKVDDRDSIDGVGAVARFNFPFGITTDGKNLYIADSGNYAIRKIVIATGVVSTLAGSSDSIGDEDGIGEDAHFVNPQGITTDGKSLFVTDTSSHTIRKIDIATTEVTTLAGTVGKSGSADGVGLAASFDSPQSITTDGTYLYVADTYSQIVRKIVIETGVVTTIAGTPSRSGDADGTGIEAGFSYPKGITTDGVSLYVTDTYNDTLRRIQ